MRRRLILVLALVLALSGSSNIYAQQHDSDINEQESIKQENIISPLFTYINKHHVNISKSDGKIKCESILSFSQNRARITNTLQKKAGSGWTSVDSKSITYSTPGTKSYAPTFSGVVGTQYRFKSLVEIINSSGKVLESVSVYSNNITY